MFNPFKIIKYHLYLLQLENYELGRFWKLLINRGWFPEANQRKELVWTAKVVVLVLLAELLIIVSSSVVATWLYLVAFKNMLAAAILFWVFLFIFNLAAAIFLVLADLILWPLDFAVKAVLVARAKSKIRLLSLGLDSGHFSRPSDGRDVKNSGMTHRGGLKVIGIAGSYGKTTMKEVLGQVLRIKYKVLSTPDSVNTPVGIARWILNKVNKSTEIVIVEMGEHYRGDIKDICDITRPDIAVVTGINESHLERMRTMGTVAQTVFEVVSAAKPGAGIFLNGDDKNVVEHYKEFVWPDMNVEKFQISNFKFQNFDVEKLFWKVGFDGVGEFEINLLGEYALGNVDGAIKIGLGLGLSAEEIKKGIANIKPVEHRLQPIKSAGDVLVIDDAYNGNPAGVAEAIKVLSRFANRRKVFVTPGLVEMGLASAEVHRAIGNQLAGVADVVVLIKNSVTGYIEEGILSVSSQPNASESRDPESRTWIPGQARNDTAQIIWFNSAQEAHASLGKILKPGDVVVFQNDWGDQYL